MSTEAPTQPPEARAKIAALFRRPNLVLWPIIVIAIGLHLLLADSFDLRVALTGVILAAGCAVDFRAERTAPYAFGLPGLMDGPPAPGKMPHSVYAHVSAVVVVAFVVLQTLTLSAGVSLALAAVAMIAWVVACVCGSPAFCAQVNAV